MVDYKQQFQSLKNDTRCAGCVRDVTSSHNEVYRGFELNLRTSEWRHINIVTGAPAINVNQCLCVYPTEDIISETEGMKGLSESPISKEKYMQLPPIREIGLLACRVHRKIVQAFDATNREDSAIAYVKQLIDDFYLTKKQKPVSTL